MHLFNPATGLPITGDDYGGVDLGGNPYGVNWNSPHPWSSGNDFQGALRSDF